MNKKLLFVPTAAVAAAIAVGSIAYACTVVQGTTSVTFGGNSAACTSDALPQTNTSGNCDINLANTREMVATADNLPRDKSYFLWFLNDAARDADPMGICMDKEIGAKHLAMKSGSNSDGTGTGAAVAVDANGDIAATTRYVPKVIKHGPIWPDQDLSHSHVHNSTASVCWMTENFSHAGNDVTVVVTGGNGTP